MNETTRSGPRVLCAGHINWDVTMHVQSLPDPDGEVHIDQLIQSGGGSAANVAVGLVGLQTPAAVYGSVGGDEAGAMALRALDRAGVETGCVLIDPEQQTSVKYLIVDETGQVMVLANDGANEGFSASAIDPSMFEQIEHLHLTSQHPETAQSLAELAHEAGVTVSFDPGRRVGDRDFSTAIDATDILFLNRHEAAAIGRTHADRDTPEKVLVVKRGGDGAVVRTSSGEVSHSGFSVDVVDTTGSGDGFAAGFLATVLSSGEVIRNRPEAYEQALIVANACGALTATESTARVPLTPASIEALSGTSAITSTQQ